MTRDYILTRFDELNTWKQGGQRDPQIRSSSHIPWGGGRGGSRGDLPCFCPGHPETR